MSRELKFHQAILEATVQCMEANPRVYLMGLGATDPKGIFGTTMGLEEKFGSQRVLDMPTSENGMTGVAIGSALVGLRPIMTHQRVDFFLLALDQLINNAAKWHYMFGGLMRVPLVIRLVIGRGWGQGPQHSQSLQSFFAHVPGLKVVMPSTPYDAKGLLVSAVEDDNPVIYLEHRWLHGIHGPVPEEQYRVPIGKARTLREGTEVTIIATSHMTIEAMRAAQVLERFGVDAMVVDVRTLKPLDTDHLMRAIQKTGRLVVADAGWRSVGFGAEILALAAEHLLSDLKCPPRRVTLPDSPCPSSWALAAHYYPRAVDIVNVVKAMLGRPTRTERELGILHEAPLDVPDASFMGPF